VNLFLRRVEARIDREREERIQTTRGTSLRLDRESEIGQMRAVVASAAARRRAKMELRERIAKLRRLGLPTREIALQLGVSDRQVYRTESAFEVS
jgi:hypothetical protein